MREHLTVGTGDRSYPVYVGPGLLAEIGDRCAPFFSGKKCAVITDSTVGELYGRQVLDSLRSAGFEPLVLTVNSGETSKSLSVVEQLLGQMAEAGLDRKSFVVALGGGVIGDLAGFVASIYFRGIPYIQVPTTVLAQVDSSVGGKTGVNLSCGKNLVGSFYPPRAVIADIATLETLPPREFNEGFAEIIKHAVIRDAALLEQLQTFDRSQLTAIIRRNIEIKSEIVSADEFETLDLRALLNFGHTIGHGIENAAGYGKLLHGEAISLGLVAAARLSVAKAGMPPSECAEIEKLLERFSLPTRLPPAIETEAILAALAKDKKFSSGQIRFILAPKIGEAFVSNEISIDDISRELAALKQ